MLFPFFSNGQTEIRVVSLREKRKYNKFD
ncbi:hypothetical protein Zm00014a_030203 [Zea mays]|uniref:Uncharacterized protein n=1 Tax=Zea mays TaxID=4577 RepID=A0A3L6D9W7_MAIZE|nr:hypothetical protein Zm00014a_030203 [Zea mays]